MAINYANRGMGLETLIEYANAQYLHKGIANIQKLATPVKVMKLSREGRIRDGWYEKKSTVDFMGDYSGRSVCFEAKSTKEETSFPLKNFEKHQIEFMRKWKGASFVLIELSKFREVYFVHYSWIISWWDEMQVGGRKSIPYSELRLLDKVGGGNGVVLDYLKFVEVSA